MTIEFIDLFCGIGGFRTAADQVSEELGLDTKCVFSSDIDSSARLTYHENFGEYPTGDITTVDAKLIPSHDILFAGFPCQPFSIIGNGDGFEDARGTLFFEIARILRDKIPKAFILENVKRLVTHNDGHTFRRIIEALTDIGYWVDYRILNALDYGLPQKRERVFIVGFINPVNLSLFRWPKRYKEYVSLSNILEETVDKKYYASERIQKSRKQKHEPSIFPSIWHENKSGNVNSHPFSCALRAGASYNYLLVNGERRLTSREMLRLQGFPEDFTIPVPYAQVRKQTGNAVPVNVVKGILLSMLPILSPLKTNLMRRNANFLNVQKRKKETAIKNG